MHFLYSILENIFPGYIFTLIIWVGVILPVICAVLYKLAPMPHLNKIAFSIGCGVVSLLLIFFGSWSLGFQTHKHQFDNAIQQMNINIAQAKQSTLQTNETIGAKLAETNKVVVYRNKSVIEYIAREVVKYDESCKLTDEAIIAHNAAALNQLLDLTTTPGKTHEAQ